MNEFKTTRASRFALPVREVRHFVDLFQQLENKSIELNIATLCSKFDNFGAVVFLKLAKGEKEFADKKKEDISIDLSVNCT